LSSSRRKKRRAAREIRRKFPFIVSRLSLRFSPRDSIFFGGAHGSPTREPDS
jgi:hypothetical protein